jgi:hypothetical protein
MDQYFVFVCARAGGSVLVEKKVLNLNLDRAWLCFYPTPELEQLPRCARMRIEQNVTHGSDASCQSLDTLRSELHCDGSVIWCESLMA